MTEKKEFGFWPATIELLSQTNDSFKFCNLFCPHNLDRNQTSTCYRTDAAGLRCFPMSSSSSYLVSQLSKRSSEWFVFWNSICRLIVVRCRTLNLRDDLFFGELAKKTWRTFAMVGKTTFFISKQFMAKYFLSLRIHTIRSRASDAP